MNTKIFIGVVVGVLLLVGGATFILRTQSTVSEGTQEALKGFATCINDSKAVFYGAFWCSHCLNQKKAFGDASSLLPYVECATPDGKGQTAVCTEAGVESYPTWVFANGERKSGELSFATLSEATGCPLPEGITE